MKQSSAGTQKNSRKSTGNTSKNQNKTGSRPSGRRETSTGNSNGSAASGQGRKSNASSQDGRSSSERFKGDSHLEKFFLSQLKDIYYAEHKIVQSLPRMQEATTTDELKDAFEDHLHQTQRHIKRLEKVFGTLGQKAEGEKCEAIEGIAREVEKIIKETEEGTLTRDAALIIAAQKVEHYEIATYGGLVQLAITMQLHEAADLLDKTLVEEEDTDARLTGIAENDINLEAEQEGSEQEEGEGEEEGMEANMTM